MNQTNLHKYLQIIQPGGITKFISEILITNKHIGVIIIDQNFNTLLWNNSMEDLTGLTQKDAIGKPINKIIPDFPKNEISLENKNIQAFSNLELRRLNDNKISSVKGNFYPIANQLHTPIGGIITLHSFKRELAGLSQTIFSASISGIIVWENIYNQQGKVKDFRYTHINDAACRMIKRERKEIIGLSLLTIFPDIVNDGTFSKYIEAAETGIPKSLEFYYPYSGLNKWYKVLASPYDNGLILCFDDITEAKNKEELSQQQKIRLENTQKLARIGDFEWNLLNNTIHCSESLLKILEINSPKALYSHEDFTNIFDHEQIKDIVKITKKVLKTRQPQNFETTLKTPAGNLKYLRGMFYNENTIHNRKVMGFCQDITERKLNENELKKAYNELKIAKEKLKRLNSNLENEVQKRIKNLEDKHSELEELFEEFKLVTNIIPQMVWVAHEDGRVYFFNQRWLEYSALEQEYCLDHQWINIVHPGDQKRVWEAWQKKLKEGSSIQIEYRLRKFDGEYRWFLARGIPIKNSSDKIYKWIGTCTDIHDQKTTLNVLLKDHEELSFQNQELSDVNFDLDNFIYTASHDLKAPITNIEGLIITLEDFSPQSEEANMVFEMIKTSIDRFKNTLHDLTKVTGNKSNGEKDNSLEIEKVVNEILQDINKDIHESGAEIVKDIQVDNFPFSRKNFRTIVYNLISNAIKYRHPEKTPQISISAKKLDDDILFVVKDNGLGINKKDLPNLFSMYKRFHNHVEGTGVGMYIVKRVIEKSGGKIEVESSEGKGTMFRVYLPIN